MWMPPGQRSWTIQKEESSTDGEGFTIQVLKMKLHREVSPKKEDEETTEAKETGSTLTSLMGSKQFGGGGPLPHCLHFPLAKISPLAWTKTSSHCLSPTGKKLRTLQRGKIKAQEPYGIVYFFPPPSGLGSKHRMATALIEETAKSLGHWEGDTVAEGQSLPLGISFFPSDKNRWSGILTWNITRNVINY